MNTTTINKLLTALALGSTAAGALQADCNGPVAFRTSIVTYFEMPDQPPTSTDPRCTIVNRNGRSVCQIRLMGILHEPLTARAAGVPRTQFPAIVYNHGSGKILEIEKNTCRFADFFVPKDYVFFFPFRRGNGLGNAATLFEPNDLDPNQSSTGRNILETKDAYRANPYSFATPCNFYVPGGLDDAVSCFTVQLLKEEATDTAEAFKWLKHRGFVDNNAMALMGNSYGGMMTVLTNAMDLGQRAAVAFSAGGQSWAAPRISAMLLDAARHAKDPAFYLQAKWDYDTRATVELAYAHTNASPYPKHGWIFMASIFDYLTPPLNDAGLPSDADMQSIHVAFAKDTDVWGTAVLDFLRRHEVK